MNKKTWTADTTLQQKLDKILHIRLHSARVETCVRDIRSDTSTRQVLTPAHFFTATLGGWSGFMARVRYFEVYCVKKVKVKYGILFMPAWNVLNFSMKYLSLSFLYVSSTFLTFSIIVNFIFSGPCPGRLK